MNNPYVDTNCPIAYGVFQPAQTTPFTVSIDTTRVGNVYFQLGEGTGTAQVFGKPRWVMIAKNASGSTLSRNLVVAHTTTTGVSFPYNIAGLAGALSLVVAGVVEDGYINGVPDGALFRMVIKGYHYLQMKTAADALVTTVVGQALTCAGDGEVFGQDNSVAAGSATFAQLNSVVGASCTITANSTDNGLQKLHYVKIPKFA